MGMRKSLLTLAAGALLVSPASSATIGFTKEDLDLAKGACLVGSSFDFITEADGSLSIKNLEGKGKLHVGNKSIDVVDVPDTDKKKEFDDIRVCIKGYLLKDKSSTDNDSKYEKAATNALDRLNSFPLPAITSPACSQLFQQGHNMRSAIPSYADIKSWQEQLRTSQSGLEKAELTDKLERIIRIQRAVENWYVHVASAGCIT